MEISRCHRETKRSYQLASSDLAISFALPPSATATAGVTVANVVMCSREMIANLIALVHYLCW